MAKNDLKPISEILPKVSKTVSTTEPKQEEQYSCQVCKDGGMVHPRLADGTVDFSRIVACKCQREILEVERNQRLIKYCELPKGTEDLTFETFDTGNYPDLKEAYQAALELAEESGDLKWLTLMSDVDRGKTHLAIAICRRWLARGKPARYVLVPLMLDELRFGFRMEGEDSFQRKLHFFMNVPLLVLDDLGTEYHKKGDSGTSWAGEKLITIIDSRYINGLPLVVTTNKPLNALPGDDEGRIASRLRRFKAGKVIAIDALEYRKRTH